jgi:hypothetical protein
MGMLREPYVGPPFPVAGNKWLGGQKNYTSASKTRAL